MELASVLAVDGCIEVKIQVWSIVVGCISETDSALSHGVGTPLKQ